MDDFNARQHAEYALDVVKEICAKIGPGLPGSPQERERAAVVKRHLETHLGAENVHVEEFTFAPWACLGSLPISALLMFIAAFLNVLTRRRPQIAARRFAIGALAFSLAAPLVLGLEFVYGFETIDPLFKKNRSMNVIGTLRTSGTRDVKRILLVSGHHDSAPENTWLSLLGNASTIASIIPFIGFATTLSFSIIQLVGVIAGDANVVRIGTLKPSMFAFPILPAIAYGVFFNRGRKNGGTVPGAADNLAASALAVAISRFLVKNPAYVPTATEIRFVSFGSEEAGLRGSRRYVKRHLRELKTIDARLLNFETVADAEILILTSDQHGTVKHSPEIVKSVIAAAQRAGVPHKVTPAFFGVATDAASFSRAGIKATTLLPFKVPEQMVAFYHQKSDTPDVLSIEALANELKLTLEWISKGG